MWGRRSRLPNSFGVLPFLPGTLLSVPAFGHHSFVAEFDETKPVKISGVVTKVEWQNPHVWFYVDIKDESGKVTNWGFGGGAPGQFMRRGIAKSVIQPGMII
jgi:hypothetical protein